MEIDKNQLIDVFIHKMRRGKAVETYTITIVYSSLASLVKMINNASNLTFGGYFPSCDIGCTEYTVLGGK